MTLSNKAYDITKKIITTVVPAVLFLLTGLAQLPELANAAPALLLAGSIISIAATAAGMVIGVSSTKYAKSLAEDSTEK